MVILGGWVFVIGEVPLYSTVDIGRGLIVLCGQQIDLRKSIDQFLFCNANYYTIGSN